MESPDASTNVAQNCSVSEMFVKQNLTFGLICGAIGFREPLGYQGRRGSYRGWSMYSSRQRAADFDRTATGTRCLEQLPSGLLAGAKVDFVQASGPLGKIVRDRLYSYSGLRALLP